MTSTDVLAAALGYAARGWPVFPLPAGEKRPRGCAAGRRDPHPGRCGLHHATTDEPQLRDWFTTDARRGLAVRTGVSSGLVVVDLDCYKPGATRPDLPVTLASTTPSGGEHHWYTHPGGYVVSRELRPGVDVKGDGGYVCAPPTRRGESAYRWVDPRTPVAPLPAWIAEELTPPPAHPPPSPAALARSRDRVDDRYLAAAVAGEAARVAATPNGAGLHDRVRASGRALGGLAHLGLDEATAVAAIVAAAGHGSYTPDEVARTARWGFANGAARPRTVPDREPLAFRLVGAR